MAVSAGERSIESAGLWPRRGAADGWPEARPLRDRIQAAARRPAAGVRRALPRRALWASRYLAAGAGSLLLNLVLQAIFIRILGLPLWLATAAAYELALLSHFAANDRWVFARSRRAWGRLLAFHAAALPASAITLAVTWALLYGPAGTTFANGFGPYLAKTLGTAVAAGWTFACCACWIWRPRPALAAAPDLAGAEAPPVADGR
jgi:putative flippase GtrA